MHIIIIIITTNIVVVIIIITAPRLAELRFRSFCHPVCHSVCDDITHDLGNERRPNMADMGWTRGDPLEETNFWY